MRPLGNLIELPTLIHHIAFLADVDGQKLADDLLLAHQPAMLVVLSPSLA